MKFLDNQTNKKKMPYSELDGNGNIKAQIKHDVELKMCFIIKRLGLFNNNLLFNQHSWEAIIKITVKTTLIQTETE